MTTMNRNEVFEKKLMSLVRHRMGIVINSNQKKELYQIFLEGCKKFEFTPEDYLTALSECSPQSPLLEHMVAGLTIGETYFYRDKRQMKLLQEMVLPNLIKQKRLKKELSLRIWSAGCASGEEIYTIAIMLDQLIDDTSQWTINLLGTDINTQFLKKSMDAEYSDWSMRAIPDKIKNQYFIFNGKKYILIDKIKKMVRFDYINLIENSYPSMFNGTNSLDLILCRNVLIYFDIEIAGKLMKQFYASLQENGFLLLGASDPLDSKVLHSNFQHIDNMLFMRPVFGTNAAAPPKIEKKSPSIKKQDRVISKPPINVYPLKKTENGYKDELLALLNDNQWQAILFELDSMGPEISQQAFFQYAKATALANLGHLPQAVKLFQSSLKTDSSNKFTHFTYALALLELNQFAEAESELRKTIFLDRHFVSGYYQLGLLLIRNKQQSAGLKCLKNAYEIAVTKKPTDEVLGSSGLHYGRLTEILQQEISLYAGEATHA